MKDQLLIDSTTFENSAIPACAKSWRASPFTASELSESSDNTCVAQTANVLVTFGEIREEGEEGMWSPIMGVGIGGVARRCSLEMDLKARSVMRVSINLGRGGDECGDSV